MGCVRRNLPHSGWLLSQGPGFRPGPQPSPLRPTIWVRFIPTGASPLGPPHAWTSAHTPCTARTTLNTSRAFRGEARAMHLQIKATDFYFSNQTYHSPHVRPQEHCHLWSPHRPPPTPPWPAAAPSAPPSITVLGLCFRKFPAAMNLSLLRVQSITVLCQRKRLLPGS